MTQSEIVKFGPGGRLVGVLSGSHLANSTVALVLPSAGLLPRTGPFRLHVDLSNRLAEKGIQTFRFDVPGVGEAPRLDGVDGRRATLAAINHLAMHHGCEYFAVGGLCSAADMAWAAAVDDERVVAMLMMDGLCFRGPWFHWAKLTKAVERIPRDGVGMLRRWVLRTRNGNRELQSSDYRDWPTIEVARRQFSSLAERGVRSLWIYTGGYSDVFRHPRQFTWTFGIRDLDSNVDVQHWQDSDHLFYAREHRQHLLETVEVWMESVSNQVGAKS